MKPTRPEDDPADGQPALDEVATEWLCERDAGFGPGRAAAFLAWCEADPQHAAAVQQIEAAMAVLETMPTIKVPLAARFGPTENPPEEEGAFAAPRLPRFRLVGLVAAALLVLFGGWYYATRRAHHEEYANHESVARRVELRDGSVIHLNTGSELRVDFSSDERRVRLQSGEVFFEVAHDVSCPFLVEAGGVVVRAIGTAFNVRLAAANVEVLVEEGRVEVAPVVAAPAAAGAPVATAPQVSAGERTRVPRTDAITPASIERVERRDLREALAWHRRSVALTNVSLEEVVDRFNRRNQVQLVLADAELKERRMGGVLFLDQVEAFVALLEQGGDVVADHRGADTIVLRRAR